MSITFPAHMTVCKRVKAALAIFLVNDSVLLELDIHERTIAHKLAEYLQIVFKSW